MMLISDGSEVAPPFRGIGVALVTLFDDSGRLDARATAEHAARLVSAGIQAVLVCGTTGEADTLTRAERHELLYSVVERVGAHTFVLAGVGAVSSGDMCQLTESARIAGVNCVLCPPATDLDVSSHYDNVREAANGLPLLAYHLPTKYPGVDVAQLDHLPIVGSKDSSGDPKRLLEEVTQSNRAIYTGSSTLLLLCSAVGGPGALVGVANALPELCITAFNGDGNAQRQLHASQRSVAGLPAHRKIKQLMADRFGTSAVARV